MTSKQQPESSKRWPTWCKTGSLALHTGLRLSTNPNSKPRDAESMAKSHMTTHELESYTDWKSNTTTLGPFDWDRHKAPLPSSTPQSVKKHTRRATAMDTVWNHSGATPEHASWLTFNMPAVLPLVKAVSRVLAAERQCQTDPLARLGPMKMAEMETARPVVTIAARTREREVQRIRQLTRSISRSTEMLNSRMGEWTDARDGRKAEEPEGRESVGGTACGKWARWECGWMVEMR